MEIQSTLGLQETQDSQLKATQLQQKRQKKPTEADFQAQLVQMIATPASSVNIAAPSQGSFSPLSSENYKNISGDQKKDLSQYQGIEKETSSNPFDTANLTSTPLPNFPSGSNLVGKLPANPPSSAGSEAKSGILGTNAGKGLDSNKVSNLNQLQHSNVMDPSQDLAKYFQPRIAQESSSPLSSQYMDASSFIDSEDSVDLSTVSEFAAHSPQESPIQFQINQKNVSHQHFSQPRKELSSQEFVETLGAAKGKQLQSFDGKGKATPVTLNLIDQNKADPSLILNPGSVRHDSKKQTGGQPQGQFDQNSFGQFDKELRKVDSKTKEKSVTNLLGATENQVYLNQQASGAAHSASEVKVIEANVIPGAMAKNRISTDGLMGMTTGIRETIRAGGGEIRIRLKPEGLGEINLKVITQGNRVNLQIQASDEHSKRILEDSIDYLKESLSAQNLTLNQFDLSVAQNQSKDADSNTQQNQSQNQSGFLDSNGFNGQGAYQGSYQGDRSLSDQFGDSGFVQPRKYFENKSTTQMSNGITRASGDARSYRIDVKA